MKTNLKVMSSLGLLVILGLGVLLSIQSLMKEESPDKGSAIPVAILGDSDSHSYRDKFDNKARGGDYHKVTFNWPALWERFRKEEVNLGRFGEWGESYRLARIKTWLGLPARAPKKLDYEFNYAVSGLRCESLLASWPYQAQWLIQRLKRSPAYWDNGLVIIRIGVNNLGSTEQLIQWSETGLDDYAQQQVDACAMHITQAIENILANHHSVKIAVLGMCRDCNLTDSYAIWPELSHIQNRDAVLSNFDAQLVSYASMQQRVLFIDDQNWLKARYSDRYNEPMKFQTNLADKITINSRAGDHPTNLILADLHAGTVYNGLWLNNLIEQLNQGFMLDLAPLSEDEIVSVIEPAL